jgi:3-deoxy-7-phosphoheptulonate synthase
MILILNPNIEPESETYKQLMGHLSRLHNIQLRIHREQGVERSLTEIYLIGNTSAIPVEDMKTLPGVGRVVRVSEEYRVLGRHKGDNRPAHFDYQGLRFGQDTLHVFAGLCAVDTAEHVETMMRSLRDHGQVCTRMGAYKPRTSPYSFQGYGKQCLPYVFELAAKYGVRVISMEVTRDEHLDDIREALRSTGAPTGVMLQIGTRNTQNFELLKTVGSQRDFPILLKRGFGITLTLGILTSMFTAIFCARTIFEAGERRELGTGDCLGFGPPSEVTFANETTAWCVYVVALARS